MKFAVCNEIYGNDWVKTCQLAKAAGFTGVEIAPHTFFKDSVLEVTAAQRVEIKKVAADQGLTICALHMCLFSPKGLHINGPDAALRAKTVEYLGHITQFAIDLGCPLMIYGSPPTRVALPEVGYAQARAWFKEGIQTVLPKAKAGGVTICIEPLTAECTNFCTTSEAAFGLVLDINHPNFGLMIDVKSCATEKRNVEDSIALFGPWLKHLHLNDAIGKAPGFGITDFAPILKAVKASGFKGWLSCEPFQYQPDAATIMPVSLAYLKSLLP